MDALREFLDDLRRQGLADFRFLGLLHLLIGHRISRADGTVIATGLTWRELAAQLKRVRWDREAVRQLGLDPDQLPPRDRERFWYTAISRAGVDSEQARHQAEELAARLTAIGYTVRTISGQS